MRINTDNIWLKIAAVITLLPLAAWPSLVAAHGADALVWGYAAATVAYAVLAVACGRERPVLAWVLIAMSLLTTAAIWML